MSQTHPEPLPPKPLNGAALTEHDRDPATAGAVEELAAPEFEAEHRF